MAKWHFYNASGERIGPIRTRDLVIFVQNGTITPETRIEDASGRTCLAKNARGLQFPETASPEPNPFATPMPNAANPFTAVPPTSDNPFVAASPFVQATPQASSVLVPILASLGKFGKTVVAFLKIALLVSLLLGIGAVVFPVVSEHINRNDESKNFITRELTKHSLNCADVTVTWTKKPSIYQTVTAFWRSSEESNESNETKEPLSASGKFTVRANPKEKLYKNITQEEGWSKLSLTEDDRKNFIEAERHYQYLPSELRNDLGSPRSPLRYNFYDVVVSPEDELLLTGSIRMSKNEDGSWQNDGGIQLDPLSRAGNSFSLNDLKHESQLGDVDRIDDPKTKNAIAETKGFLREVEPLYDDWSIEKILKKSFTDLGKDQSLDNIDVIKKPEKFGNTVSGKFTVKARTPENLYKKIDKKAALEKLEISNLYERQTEKMGITGIFEKELSGAGFWKSLDFYELHTPSGTAVTLTGNIKLTKPENGDWRLEEAIKADSIVPELDGTITGSQLQLLNACLLDDPTVKTAIASVVNDYLQMAEALVKQKDDFTRLCQPGAKFKGKHRSNGVGRDVTIEFESADEDTARGKITSNFFDNNIPRPFTVNLNRMEKVEFPIKGSISLQRGPAESISIRFEGDTMVFKMDADNSTSNLQRTQDVAPNKNAAKPDRKWIAPILEKWIRENAGTIRLAKEAPQNAAPGQFGNPLQNVGVQDAVELAAEMRNANYDRRWDTREFVVYGTKQLQNAYDIAEHGLRNANAFNREANQAALDEVKKEIDVKRNIIGQKTFVVGPLSYGVSDDVKKNDNSALTMSINLDIPYRFSGTIKDIVIPGIPVPGVVVESIDTNTRSYYDVTLRITGRADGIEKLYNNEGKNYQVRVYFNNLRCRDKNSYGRHDSLDANITRIEIFAKEEAPIAAENAAQQGNGIRRPLPGIRRGP